ncbi:MAG: ATP-binding cassette domain-containing protein [Myxococcota bacterium]
MLQLANVEKRYDDAVALEKISLTLERGASLAIVGTSGSGKSTLLRLVNGIVWPDSGSVHIEGELLSPASARRLRQRMGYVIQDGGLFPHLTARENVMLLARHLGWDAQRIAARTRELAELMRLRPEMLDRYPAQLSGGQQQRVGLMRALFLSPGLLLLDEPLGALDPTTRVTLQDELRSIFDVVRCTVLLVTHDFAEAGALANEIMVMHRGAVQQRGTLADIVNKPATERVAGMVQAERRRVEVLVGVVS